MLSLTDIYKTFPFQSCPTLNGISLHLAPGEFCVVLGNNGSGKTTLFKAITGETSVDSGCVKLANHNLTDVPLHKRAKLISSVTQETNTGTILEMSLLENIVLSLIRGKESQYRSYQSYKNLALNALLSLDAQLVERLHHKLSLLSGGQRQMVATLMALLSHPKLLLLDEHTSALDPQTQKKLMNYTADKIKENNITTLMITHNIQQAVNYGDRLIMIHQGKIILDLKGEEKSKFRAECLLPLFDTSIPKSEINHAITTN